MSEAENKARCLRMVASWNRWRVEGITDYWAPDVVHYSQDRPVSSAAMVALMEEGLRAFPDLHLDVRSIMAEGDRVILRITVTATHTGEFQGVPPTGRRVTWYLVEELRFAEGRVVEHWDVINHLPMLERIGQVAPAA
ncbi:ester cyclase [Marinitenerispora sediminis]|uniref:Ester cyclase n=1 Tax=Marinitenerispora sediminis TaxID=1931232 RepID=A0A368SZ37_9ACTN|nr:ester cyclase [Marinitenerispora sediminis]RCV47761.1 ester cyclase [Marinitenerispora sediminis]RCV48319.1 ester cyclase [Marinitenerispora sediminis]RCV50076.1 ester cyclase [Marinitenerispora sediminis]